MESGLWGWKRDCTEGDEPWRRFKTGPGGWAFAPQLGRPLISPTLGQGASWVGWRQRVFGETRAAAMLMSLPLILNPWRLWAQPFLPFCPPSLPMQGSHFHLPKSLPSAAITSSTSPSLYLPTEMLLPHPSYLPRYKEQEHRKQKHTPWCYKKKPPPSKVYGNFMLPRSTRLDAGCPGEEA